MSSKLKIQNPYKKDGKIDFTPPFIQLGPGPCNSTLSVLNALTNQPLTFANHYLYKIFDEILAMTKYVYQTKNEFTVVAQYSGNGGNEATVVNLADPGDTVIVATAGIWGMKVADMGRRYNLNVVELKIPLGEVYTIEQLEQEIIKHKPVVLFVTHGESSSGILQPLEGLGEMCHKYDCLLAVDAVMSLGVVPLLVDEWQIDAANAGTQKGLGAPAGMTLITFSDRAYNRMVNKKHPVPYVHDLKALGAMWRCYGQPRRYIYTFGTHMLMCVRQALKELCEEGLESVWLRHQQASELFLKLVQDKFGMGHLLKQVENRFCALNCVVLPKDIKWPFLLDYTIDKYNLEFGIGVGPLAGKSLRVCFLGPNAKPEVVEHFVEVLEDGFKYLRSNKVDPKKCKVLIFYKEWLGNLTGETFDEELQ